MKNKETSEIILHVCLINKILFHAVIFVLASKNTTRAALAGNERNKVYMCSAQWNVDLSLFGSSAALHGICKMWNIVLWSNVTTLPTIISTQKSFIKQINRFSN